MRVAVVQGSLTEGEELVLVNASNTNVQLGTGVSGAIRRACGKGYQAHIVDELNATFGGPMSQGEVLVTDAGAHPHARWVAHVAVMDYRDGFTGDSFPTLETIRLACVRLWSAIEGMGERDLSVAMVALGAGTGNLGVRAPTEIACATLADHVAKHPDSAITRVVFYGFEATEYLAMADVVTQFHPEVAETLSPDVRDYLRKARGL